MEILEKFYVHISFVECLGKFNRNFKEALERFYRKILKKFNRNLEKFLENFVMKFYEIFGEILLKF